MKREHTLLHKNNSAVKVTVPVNAQTKNTAKNSGLSSKQGNINNSAGTGDSKSESLSMQLSTLHSEVADVKDLLEELSSEGDHVKQEVAKEPEPEALERQLTSLQDEVAEVKEMLEQLEADKK